MRPHPKYGVNPIITTCYFCGEEKGLILSGSDVKWFKEHGLCSEDGEMNSHVVIDKEPCSKCQEYMEKGIITISVKDGESGDNPYRTGGWCVLSEEFFTRVISDQEMLASIMEHRCVFLEDTTWDAFEIPRNVEINNL